MSAPASCLYECTVMHRRLHPKVHGFTYRLFLFHLDLDELPAIASHIPFFSHNTPNIYSLDDRDYFQIHSRGIRENVLTFLQSEGFPELPAKIHLLTLPRLFGYTFNPISIFYCLDAADRPLVSVVQVGNTFGELKPFLVPLAPNGTGFHLRTPKNYYVSPFSSLDLEFDFRFDMPGHTLRVLIDDYAHGDKTLVSSLTGTRLPLTPSTLATLSLKYPLITLKIILLIHWEALRLWVKKIPFHKKESHPSRQQAAYRSRD